jgi:putative membrane protein
MEPYQWWWHGMGFMWMFPLLFLVVLVLCVALFVRGPWWSGRGHERGSEHRETAREILDRRFASGEITKEQYEEMKRTLAT